MDKTKRLYDDRPYEIVFDAVVMYSDKCNNQDNTYNIILNETLFFPEEGGQSPDKGEINGFEVLDVQIHDGVIVHTVKGSLNVGESVKGQIDWAHRFSNMQQHSGEHIFSGLVNKFFGYDNVGFHLSDQSVTMDFNGVLTDADVSMIEFEANKIICKNIPITPVFPNEEELSVMNYRSKKEINEQIRIVTIGQGDEIIDVCACCAPHVRSTGEIGMLKVIGRQNYKGGVRVNILCGFRALADYNQKDKLLSELVSCLSEKTENIVMAVERLKDNLYATKQELNNKTAEFMEYKLKNIQADSDNVCLFESVLDDNATRNTVNKLMEMYSGLCAVFVGNDTDGYRFIIGSKNRNCKEVINTMKSNLAVRGGGTELMVQGQVLARKTEIEDVFKKF